MESRGFLVTRVADLYALQEVDSQADAARARLEEIAAHLGDEEALAPLREAVAAWEARRLPLVERQRALESAVEHDRRHVQAEEQKLYGGSIRNPRELEDLQQEVETLKRHLREREDELLAVLGELEEVDAGLAAAQEELARAEAAWRQEQEDLRREQERLAAELTQLEARRDPQARRLAPEALRLYEQLRQSRGGRAVVRVERGTCQGCRITLPMNLLQRARSGMTIVQCSSCGRILYAG